MKIMKWKFFKRDKSSTNIRSKRLEEYEKDYLSRLNEAELL